ncbi:IS66 family insertion sequence element accessory protein TnpB [Sphingobacterium suaedae]|uniref:IS66 family insertion sequence element accessory protein TnpB n=2 Tax=Sphingobacterium suaedae TaxID=1686402 RepID=A0ABW5KMM8_9SPHI
MFAMIADWQQSGMSKKRYCEENGINEATFYYWFSRSKENDTSNGSFIAIDKAGRNSAVEVIYPNGVRIKVETYPPYRIRPTKYIFSERCIMGSFAK